MNTNFEYRGWLVKVGPQVYFPPFKRFIAICEKVSGKSRKMFNVEANTIDDCIKLAKEKITYGDFPKD